MRIHSIEQALSISIGPHEYAVDARGVREVRVFRDPIRIGRMPEHVAGVLETRSGIVPMFDLRTLAGSPALFSPRTATIVIEVGYCLVAAVVDAIGDFFWLAEGKLLGRPTAQVPLGEFVTGVCALPSRDVLMLDLPGLLGDEHRLLRGRTV